MAVVVVVVVVVEGVLITFSLDLEQNNRGRALKHSLMARTETWHGPALHIAAAMKSILGLGQEPWARHLFL